MIFPANDYVLSKYDQKSFHNELSILRRGIFLDTSALFILIVGHYDKIKGTHFLSHFDGKKIYKRQEKHYETADYDCLIAFLNSFGLGSFKLLVTPHIFTEFMKHLSAITENYHEDFKYILKDSLKSKWYLEDHHNSKLLDFANEPDLINKKLEVGDISITICANLNKCNKNPIAIITDDEAFYGIANKNDLMVVYYTELRGATFNFRIDNRIPDKLLNEPIEK